MISFTNSIPSTPFLPVTEWLQECPAKAMGPEMRRDLAVAALAGEPVSHLADEHDVSRKFVYQQVHCACEALNSAFPSAEPVADETVLFQLPITKSWLRQFVLGMTLIGHSSFRGVTEMLRDLFDTSMSIGTVHNIVRQAVEGARVHNAQQDLSAIRIGAHDEIFQSGLPVLAGAEVFSTYCYLLSQEEHRDADTWGIRLLELGAQGLHPDVTIADAGSGLRAGQALAWPEVSCRGDVFHPLLDLGRLVNYLDNRALGVLTARDKLERQMIQAKRRGRERTLSTKLTQARQEETQALDLVDDVALLARWLREDVLSVAGPDYPTRISLFDFIVAELEMRQPRCPHRIGPVVRFLKNQRDDLLAFAKEVDEQVAELAQAFQTAPDTVREVLLLDAMNTRTAARWQCEAHLRRQLGNRFHALREAVVQMASQVVRASSIIENLNSRLRNYFFLRRHLGPEYLDLLRFFLNHRRFLRSEHPERVNKSPTELLTGQTHSHWLELLGYQRFRNQ